MDLGDSSVASSTVELSSVEQNMETLLAGRGLDEPALYDAAPEVLHPVRLRKSVTYIVVAVLLNNQDEVLLIQEAKPECYEKWYLPAGRMEQNETIMEALKREVQEETGLKCEARTLLAVQEHGSSWIRYVFLAERTGGKLKTTEEADKESLQARWWDRVEPLPLRAPDILPLIDMALKYKEQPKHPFTLPHETVCTMISQRLLVTFTSAIGELWVLLATRGSHHLPVTATGSSVTESHNSLRTAVFRLLKQCLLLPEVNVQTHGILALQHMGRGRTGKADGLCLNLLLSVTHSGGENRIEPPSLHSDSFQWLAVLEGDLKEHLMQRVVNKSVVPLISFSGKQEMELEQGQASGLA